ncbi:MAG TPA: hypothetical protein VM618_08560, partial [Acidimicrobiia bacterium]|nr:hypothetical protein [Acidimicrobiia bacterium]
MADDDIFDEEPEDQPARRRPGGAEGVRIVGAEEARAAYEEGRVTPRKSPDEPRPGDRPEAPPLPPAPPAARFPLADDDAPDLGRRLFHDADEGDAFDDLASRGDARLHLVVAAT